MHKDPYSSSRASIGAGRNAEARQASGWAPPVSSDTERIAVAHGKRLGRGKGVIMMVPRVMKTNRMIS